MPRLTRTDQISFISMAEIKEGMERILTTARYEWRLRHRGGKLQQYHLHNAVLLHFLALDPARQQDVLATGLDLLDTRLDADAGDNAGAEARREAPSPPAPLIGDVEHRTQPDMRDDPTAPRRVVG